MRFLGRTPSLISNLMPCRACLGPLGASASAGICERCWENLAPLPEMRCPTCALVHELDTACPDACAWTQGDAFWDYHGGRPALGALLVPAIKDGELGWRKAILSRVETVHLPEWCLETDLVTVVPSAFHRRLLRGFDLAEDAAHILATRLEKPFLQTLRRKGWSRRQALRTETQRRRLPARTMALRHGLQVRRQIQNQSILLVDDVWTTGTTLLRCSQRLLEAGAREVRVLTLFRSLSSNR